MLRVMVVDNSAPARNGLKKLLGTHPGVRMVGYYPASPTAIQRIAQSDVNLLILGYDNQSMGGMSPLEAVRYHAPDLRILLLLSSPSPEDPGRKEARFDGNCEVLLRPRGDQWDRVDMDYIGNLLALVFGQTQTTVGGSGLGSPSPAAASPTGRSGASQTPTVARSRVDPAEVAARLMAQVPGAATESRPQARRVEASVGAGSVAEALPPPRYRSTVSPISAVVIGSSTGGPDALAHVFKRLPLSMGVPIFIVQHMPPNFTGMLAKRLSYISEIDVVECLGDEVVEPGRAYLAPGGRHMVLARKGVQIVTQLNDDAPVNSCRPAVDPLFESAVDVYGGDLLGVILTGMGRDGLDGCRVISKAGGHIIAQDEESSVVWGMPGFVAKEGLAHRVLPLSEVADEVMLVARRGRA